MGRFVAACALLPAVLFAAVVEPSPVRTISGKVVGPNPAGLRVALNGGQRIAVTLADGSFAFGETPAGVYALEITGSTDFLYPSYKINVPESPAAEVQAVEYRYPGAPKLPARYPLEVPPVARPQFFEERPKFTLWSIVANPMVLMVIVMCVASDSSCAPHEASK
jgi:hypothetical protein